MATNRAAVSSPPQRRRTMSALEARISLVTALATQASSVSQQHKFLGILWDIDTDVLREYMSKYGELEDCIVMKERSTGRSRGFGYVTFASAEDAKSVSLSEHFLL
ncbi:glycine-rich RNA-binding protein 3, mitochondrial-like [Rosa chinensis]|uniref:glycine-rich RNA-binding protein 3, mitochondrial-like n=1 Tax=Rosa chinensis TaxID=74649 RepID=UPI001AD8C78F|nr:glycine-rich RNA-binding protein 3, mitochondrial-like [Rosa chinensis]